MAFILAKQREEDCRAAFARYRSYLSKHKRRFPKRAYALAMSDWYYSFDDYRAPHDAHLQSITFGEKQLGQGSKSLPTSIQIMLLGALRDVLIEFSYSGVIAYSISASDLRNGHCDWRYDEFRVSESGHLIHEIEWWGAGKTANWTIEATDIRHECLPLPPTSKD